MNTPQEPPPSDPTLEGSSAEPGPVLAADQLRKRRMMIGIAIGVIAVLAIGTILAISFSGNDEEIEAQAAPTTVATSLVPTTRVTVPVSTTTTTVAETTTTIPETTTTVAETTTTVAETTTTVAETTTVPETTVPPPPPTAAPVVVTPVTAAPGLNCAVVGTIGIPSTGVFQNIIKETKPYADGLLCGNHRNDGVQEGVDVLPGFASFQDSLAGGPTLVGQIPAVIFGHRNSHNRPFNKIDDLLPGDIVVVTENDGTVINMQVDRLELQSLADATTNLLARSPDGAPQVRLVACAHADGTPGGVSHRWIATLIAA